jgi:hypothetical protein
MKRVAKIAVCLAGGLVLNTVLQASDALPSNNPYAPIVTRNIFGLNPPQAADAADANPPPKITPTGIMTIFGTRQALFTVDGVIKPGQPGKNQSYILSQGQRQDDIEVTRIDEKSGVVTFKNHGVVQEIPLTKAPANAIPAPVTPAVTPSFGSRAGRSNGDTSRTIQTRGSGFTQQSQPSQQPMTQEAQIISMEVNRQLTADKVRAGTMPPLPPTSLTPEGAPGYIPMPPMPGQ